MKKKTEKKGNEKSFVARDKSFNRLLETSRLGKSSFKRFTLNGADQCL